MRQLIDYYLTSTTLDSLYLLPTCSRSISVMDAWVRLTVLNQTPSIPCRHYCCTDNMKLLLNQNTDQYSGNTRLLPQQCSASLQGQFIRFMQHSSSSGPLWSPLHLQMGRGRVFPGHRLYFDQPRVFRNYLLLRFPHLSSKTNSKCTHK